MKAGLGNARLINFLVGSLLAVSRTALVLPIVEMLMCEERISGASAGLALALLVGVAGVSIVRYLPRF